MLARRRTETWQYSRVLEAAPDAIVGVNRHGQIQLVNAQTEALFGYARGQLVGWQCRTECPPAALRRQLAHDAAGPAAVRGAQCDFRIICRSVTRAIRVPFAGFRRMFKS